MTTKPLTNQQATEIAFALLGIEPNLKLYDPREYDQRIEIINNKPIAGAAQLGIQIDFRLLSEPRGSRQERWTTYQLYIGYYETLTGINPGVIALFQVSVEKGEEVMQVEVMGNLSLVTDKLRAFDVWPKSNY
ncbi:hypothetical protein [Spirosoma arcticum]